MLPVEERAIAGNPELAWQSSLGEFLPKQTRSVCVKLGSPFTMVSYLYGQLS